jgi:peptidoglycan/xylan/chitin deacetylase (PgdA/CDA1 family)
VRPARARRLSRTTAILVAVLFGSSLAMLQAQPARSHPPPIAVRVNGVLHHVPGPTTVAAVLRATGVRTERARLVSAVSHKVLRADNGPPTLLVDGLPAGMDSAVGADAAVVAVDGPVDVEPVAVRTVPVAFAGPGPGLPEVENTLWYPGLAGADEETVGAVSGEVVGRRRVREPVGPRRELAPVVALTFDDGPDPRWTPQVLQILREEGVKATFCVVGYVALRFPELVKGVQGEGHVLCDHTMHHVEHLDQAPHPQVEQEVVDGLRAVQSIVGSPPSLYRAPGGFLGPDVIGVARGNGLRVLGWAIDPHDYERPPLDVLIGRVMGALRPGAVILLHDGGGDRSTTVAALRPVIQQVKAMGWSFATPMSGPPPPA